MNAAVVVVGSHSTSESGHPPIIPPVKTHDNEHLRVRSAHERKVMRAIKRLTKSKTDIGAAIREIPAEASSRLQRLAMDLRSFGNLRTKKACIQAAAVLSLLTTGKWRGTEYTDTYLDRTQTRLPRDMERGEDGTWYVHFKNQDRKFFSPSKTVLVRHTHRIESLSMRIMKEGHDLVCQKYLRRDAYAEPTQDTLWLASRQGRVYSRLKEAGVPYVQAVIEFTQSNHPNRLPNKPDLAVLELTNLGTVSDRGLSSQKLTPRQRWMFFMEILKAVKAMHSANFVHGSLGGKSIRMVKLTDSAGNTIYEPRISEYENGSVLKNGAFCRPNRFGHQHHQPPEFEKLLLNKSDATQWKGLDIWQLGYVGLRHFAETISRRKENAVRLTPGLSPIDWNNMIWNEEKAPQAIQDFLKMMLNPDPNQRYTAEQAIEALDYALATMA